MMCGQRTRTKLAVLIVAMVLTLAAIMAAGARPAGVATTALAPSVVSTTERVDTVGADVPGERIAVADEQVERPRVPEKVTPRHLVTGEASYYGPGFAGRPTASGETFNPGAMTAAHKTLPFGTRLRVTNLRNGRHVEVRVNDRGPYAHGRVLDLSEGAAARIGMVSSGTARVKVEVVS